jgi:hypothetical protein
MDVEVRSTPGWDRPVGVLLMVLFALGCAVASFLGVMLVFVSDSCSDTTCNTGLIAGGMVVTGLVPWGCFVAALVACIVRVARRNRIWWVPLLGILAGVVAAVAGIAIAFAGGPNTFQ